MKLTPIQAIQGAGLESPLAGELVRTRGVNIGNTRKGYFIQDPSGSDDPDVSAGIFVYSRHREAPIGALPVGFEIAGGREARFIARP